MCESKVHAWVKLSCSALCVNSMTRLAGGLVWRVTAKSNASVLSRSGDGGGGAEGEVDAAREVASRAPEAGALVSAPEPVGGRAGEQGVEAVGAEGDDDERGAEQGYLRRDRAARRVHELGQEGEEEERGLGVQDVDDHALREDARQRLVADGWGGVLLVAGEEASYSEVDQVRNTEPLDHREGG